MLWHGDRCKAKPFGRRSGFAPTPACATTGAVHGCNLTMTRRLRRAFGVSVIAALPFAAAAAQQPATIGPASATVQSAPAAGDPAATAPLPAVPLPPAMPLPTGEPRLEDFAPLPGNVAWPTVETTTQGETAAAAGDIRYTVAITGLEGLGLQDEFRALSSLWTKKAGVSNLAQINRRVVEDRDLIDQLLRSIGHYGGNTQVVVTAPASEGQPTGVALTVTPGPLYHFDTITVSAPEKALGETALGGNPALLVTPLLGIKPGDPVIAAKVTAAQDALAARIADAGFPFPVVGKPDIIIDHANRTATLAQTVDLGARGVHGGVHITGQTQKFDDRHLAVLARFKPGQPYTEAGRDDLRRALIQTGLFGSVSVKPIPGGAINPDGSQVVDILVTTEAAPVRTVAASGGYSTGQGIRIEGSWAHRNLFPPEGGLTVRGVGAEREQLASAELRRMNFRRRDQTLNLQATLSSEQQDAYHATSFILGASIERLSNIIWQKPWTYNFGVQAIVTRQRDLSAPTDPNDLYYILAFPGSATWDRSNNLLDPTRGFRLTGRVSPEVSRQGSNTLGYVKLQGEASSYLPIGTNLVLAGRVHLGSIAGASRGSIAPDRRFYAGGGGSVRGFDYQGVGPKDATGTPTGGNSLTEASAEIRYRFQAFGNDLGVVSFVDAGQVYASTLPRFTSLRVGAGVGLRYYTAFGPVRIDIATPVTRNPGDPRVAFYVSIGQAF